MIQVKEAERAEEKKPLPPCPNCGSRFWRWGTGDTSFIYRCGSRITNNKLMTSPECREKVVEQRLHALGERLRLLEDRLPSR
jgi:hypothetical protein